MARKRRKSDHDHVKTIVESLIADGRSFDDSERKSRRENALAYQAGEMPDLPAEDGRSSIVEEIQAEQMDFLLPSIMRVFASTDRVVDYEPVPPDFRDGVSQQAFMQACRQNEEFAEEATEYVNRIFLKECQGEKLLRDAIYDGLLHGNGVIKHWWDATPEHRIEEYRDLSDDAFVELVSGDDVEVLEHSERPDPTAVDPASALVGAGGLGSQGLLGSPMGGMGAVAAGTPTAGLNPMAPGGNGGGGGSGGLGGGSPIPSAVLPAGIGPQQHPLPVGGPNAQPAPSPLPLAGMGNAGAPGAIGTGVPAPVAGGPLPLDQAAGGLLDGIGTALIVAPPILHDLKIKRLISSGRLRVRSLADEDFLIESAATALNEDECRFCAHVDTPTRSELLARGYDEDLVMELGEVSETTTETTRRGRNWRRNEDYAERIAQRVEVYECYALLDPEEQGEANWYQVVVGGPASSREILAFEEWGGKLPFSDLVPDPIPHSWKGRSLYDRLRDPQRVATAISRRVLDNAYMTVEPMMAVQMAAIENPDAVYDRRIGGVIRVKGGMDARTAIVDLATPFVAKEAAPIIDEQRRIAERRTGVGEQSSGLDADALSGQVATAVAATQSAASLRKEDYARNIQIGLRRAFTCMLRLMVENQDRPQVMLLRKAWVRMEPSAWSPEMDVTVNVGLGGGNRDRDLAMLQGIAQKQEMIGQVLWPKFGFNCEILPLTAYLDTLRKMTEASGVKGADRFFPDVSEDVLARMSQQGQQQAQQPDPKMAAAQAQLQIAAQKAQADQQLAQAKAQADAQLQGAKAQQQQQIMQAKLEADMRVREAEMQHRMEMDRVRAQQETAAAQAKAQIELEVQQAKNAAQLEMQRHKAEADLHIRTMELQFEAQLKARQQAAGINPQNTTNLERPL